MFKFKFRLTHCLIWYHAMDGLIRIRSIMPWNHIAWTRWPMGIRGRLSTVACFVAWRDHDNAIMKHCSHSVEVWVYRPSKTTMKRWYCSGNEKKNLRQQATLNIQNTEDDLTMLLRILSIILFIISSTILIHPRDYAVYAWTQVDTIRVRTETSCREFRQ